ncbi:MAG TPA: lipoate protein ligase C-terminal domain-containing protein [Candidatus Gracilibacteria bacterium]|nr:lipoate protein ligase C-terminal domain-containing protein [Candidatus Gracilibacteria bacterium]
MKFQATKKIPGGKLVSVKMETTSNGAATHISNVSIYGDFFLHPEDAITHVEQALQGLSTESSIQIFTQEIEKALAEKSASFIGVTPENLAEIIVNALHSNL